MATKQQVIKRLQKVCPSAYIQDNSGPLHFDVDIFSPDGYLWDGDCSSLVVCENNCGDKSLFWDTVLEEVNNLPDIERLEQ